MVSLSMLRVVDGIVVSSSSLVIQTLLLYAAFLKMRYSILRCQDARLGNVSAGGGLRG